MGFSHVRAMRGMEHDVHFLKKRLSKIFSSISPIKHEVTLYARARSHIEESQSTFAWLSAFVSISRSSLAFQNQIIYSTKYLRDKIFDENQFFSLVFVLEKMVRENLCLPQAFICSFGSRGSHNRYIFVRARDGFAAQLRALATAA